MFNWLFKLCRGRVDPIHCSVYCAKIMCCNCVSNKPRVGTQRIALTTLSGHVLIHYYEELDVYTVLHKEGNGQNQREMLFHCMRAVMEYIKGTFDETD